MALHGVLDEEAGDGEGAAAGVGGEEDGIGGQGEPLLADALESDNGLRRQPGEDLESDQVAFGGHG